LVDLIVQIIAGLQVIVDVINDGKTGILVDPQNKKSIGEAMLTVSRDKKVRSEMIAKGLSRSKNFKWSHFSKKILETIHEIGNC